MFWSGCAQNSQPQIAGHDPEPHQTVTRVIISEASHPWGDSTRVCPPLLSFLQQSPPFIDVVPAATVPLINGVTPINLGDIAAAWLLSGAVADRDNGKQEFVQADGSFWEVSTVSTPMGIRAEQLVWGQLSISV